MVRKEYRILCGLNGKQSYDNGTHISSMCMTVTYYFMGKAVTPAAKDLMADKWSNSITTGNLLYINGEYYFDIVFPNIAQEDEAELNAFISANGSVFGHYPPTLLSPSVIFVKSAVSDMRHEEILKDLNGRGVVGQGVMYNGDDFEIWMDHIPAQAEKNRLGAMWQDHLKFQ